MPKIIKNGDFEEMYAEVCEEDVLLESEIQQRIRWFKQNPDDTRLDNHKLTKSKKMIGKWAFSITDDIRIVYEWVGKTTVRFLAIGGHKRVYKRKA